MTYAAQQPGPRRYIAIGSVLLIHTALGFALVKGLTPAWFEPPEVPTILSSRNYEEPKPTPPPEPAATQEPTPGESRVIAPAPPITLNNTNTLDEVDPVIPDRDPFVIIPLEPRYPPQQPAEPAFTPQGASPRGDAAKWATHNDYPRAALRREEQGTTSFRLIVGSNGLVKTCEITASSGSQTLDEATCKLVSRRAKFHPAMNAKGEKVVGSYSNAIVWQLPR